MNSPKTPRLARIEPKDSSSLKLGWSNGEIYALPYFEVRFNCPCAGCVDEHSGKRTLKREQISADVKPSGVFPVGRYAVQINWSDGHTTGIYSFDTLYSLCVSNVGMRMEQQPEADSGHGNTR